MVRITMKHICPHSMISAAVSLGSAMGAVLSWVVSHGPTWLTVIGSAVAIVAGLYSIQVSRRKIRLIELQTKNEERKDKQ